MLSEKFSEKSIPHGRLLGRDFKEQQKGFEAKVGSLVTSSDSIYKSAEQFDLLLWDEAAKQVMGQVLVAMLFQKRVRKIVLVGDGHQLEPFVHSCRPLPTYFLKSAIVNAGAPTIALDLNYRVPAERASAFQ